MAKATPTTRYSVHPSIAHTRAIIRNLESQSGKSMEQMALLLIKKGPKEQKAQLPWLRAEYGLGAYAAHFVIEHAAGRGAESVDPDAYLIAAERHVEAMFAGRKAGLRPIYDALLELCLALGPEAKVCPCQTMVPIYREHVIAHIKPTTLTRIDLGLALGDEPLSGRLLDTGGLAKKDRITRRIPITSVKEIDAEVKRWLKEAYKRDG